MFNNFVGISFILINVAAFGFMAWDKYQAKTGGWRVSEKRFYLLAVAGGGIGILAAMPLLNHKTSKWKFKLPLYVILIIQMALFWKFV